LQIDLCLIVCFYGLLIIIFCVLLGVSIFPFLQHCNNHKLDFRSFPCVFLGYNSSHLGYRCFDIASQRIYISCHARFHEHVFLFDNSKQITKVSSTPPTQTATNILPNLLHSPLFPTHTALPPQTAHPPQHSPLSYPSSHACLSNHCTADTTCKSVTPTFLRDPLCWCWDNLWFFLCSSLFGQCPSYYRLYLCLRQILP
jgi:hypothetical protein